MIRVHADLVKSTKNVVVSKTYRRVLDERSIKYISRIQRKRFSNNPPFIGIVIGMMMPAEGEERVTGIFRMI